MTAPETLDARPVEVSVLVPILDEAARIRATVAAMQAQQFEGEIEYLLLDGGSSDGTTAIVGELARGDRRVRLLDNPGRRVPHALNLGLREARGEFIARMDAHALYRPDYVARGVERLLAGDVVWVGGPALPVGMGSWSRRVELALSSRLGVGGATFRRPLDTETEVDTTFAGVWRRGTLEALGGWDEGWPVNSDAELAARTRKAGGRIVCLPEMAAGYIPRDSLASLGRQYWRFGHYRAKTARRHPESLRRSHLLPPALAVTLVASVLAPGRVRSLARMGICLYGLALAVASAGQAKRGRRADAALLPAVFLTMHLPWGVGFLSGLLRYRTPVALARHRAPSSGSSANMTHEGRRAEAG